MATEGSYSGVYGFRLEGVAPSSRLLVEAPEDWPVLAIERGEGRSRLSQDLVGAEAAELSLRNGGEVALRRNPLSARFLTPAGLSDEALVHPHLGPVAAIAAWWQSRESLHAGSVVAGDTVLALVGERESGKSSTLAALARQGVGVFGDDVLIAAGRRVFAGPRTLDLRRGAAERFGVGEASGAIGERERWRMYLDSVPPTAELAGIVYLEWGDAFDLRRLTISERLERAAAARVLHLPAHAQMLLELASLPAWQLQRPRRWDSVTPVTDVLLDLLSEQARQPAPA